MADAAAATAAPAAPAPADKLKASLRGELLVPGDAGYEEAILNWNADGRQRPQFVALVLGPSDVALCLAFCREQKLPMSVFGGGHSMSSKCLCSGFVISLKRLRSVMVDPSAKSVWVGGGCTWGDVDRECEPYHLHSPGGTVSHTGVGGLTLGGGFDPALSRRRGLAIDSLLEVEVVTADGKTQRASKTQNEDLFFCLRGAGPAFGVVTAFKFQLYETPELCYGGPLIFPLPRMKEVTDLMNSLMRTSPLELTMVVASFNPRPQLMPVSGICFFYTGDPADNFAGARKYVDQFRALGPVMDFCGPVPYPVLHTFFDGDMHFGVKAYASSSALHYDDVTDELFAGLIEVNSRRPELGFLVIEQWGGNASKKSNDGTGSLTPFQAGLSIMAMPLWEKDEDRAAAVAWAREVSAFVRSKAKHPVFTYTNFNEADGKAVEMFGQENLDKLKKLKQHFDPNNLFSNTSFRI